MRTTNAVVAAFAFPWLLPPYAWLVYEVLNPTDADERRAWKYHFDSNLTSELPFIVISLIAFLLSLILVVSSGFLVSKIQPPWSAFKVPNYVGDIVLAISFLGMIYGVLEYFTIFVTLFLLVSRSYDRLFFGIFALVLIIWLQIQGYFSYKFCLSLFLGIVFFEIYARFRRAAIVLAIVGATLVSSYLGYRFYPSLTWLFEGSLNFEIFLYDVTLGVHPRPNIAHYFVCDIYSASCFDYMASIEIFLPAIFPIEFRLPLSILFTVLTSLILLTFLPKTIDSASATFLSFGWFGLINGNLTLCVAGFLVSILRSQERNSL